MAKVARTSPHPRRRGPALVITVILLIAAGLAGRWWYSQQRATFIAETVPPRPDLAGWSPDLVQRIAFDERRALHGPDPAHGLAELARLYHANGFIEEARRCYHGLVAAGIATPRERYRLAYLESGIGESVGAEQLLRDVLADEPDFLPARLRLGDLLLKSSRVGEAVEEFNAALEGHSDDPYVRLGLARCAMETRDWPLARQHLEAAVEASEYELGVDLVVTVYEQLGLADRAQAIRGRMKAWGAFQDMPDPWLEELNADSYDAYRLSLASGVAKRRGQLDQARDYLERAVSVSPTNAMMQFELGRLLLDMRRYQEARAALERCTDLAPKFPDGWAYLCGVLEATGDSANGARMLARGLVNCPDSPGLHHMRAKRHQAAERFDAAIADFRTAIRLRPTEADAQMELATLLIKLERVDEGVAELHAALRAEPEQPMALCLLGLHAINRGNQQDARNWIERARKQPRVAREDITRLVRAFEQTFGTRP